MSTTIAVVDAEQFEDPQVLFGLRLPPLGGGDDEQAQPVTPPTPASMLRRNLTWPGTSTKLSSAPDGRVVWAKPRSIVRPRRFSSSNRSGSVPVSASTNDDLPWST